MITEDYVSFEMAKEIIATLEHLIKFNEPDEIEKEYIEEPKIAFGDWGDKEKKEAIITCLKYMRFIKKITNQEYDDLIKWLANNTISNVSEKEKCLRKVKQKEQKPSIFPPGLGEVHWNPIPSGKDVHKWNLPEDFEEAVYKVANFISPFDSQEELRKVSHRFAEQLMSLAKRELMQKPAEWDKEDKEMFEAVDESLYCYESGKAPEVVAQIEAERCWLSSLPERFNLQPKQEWSEEDEKDMAHIIRILDDCYVYGTHDLSKTDRENLVNKLKSLRPSWKPSEQEKGALRTAIHVLTDERNFPKAAAHLQNILNAFEGEESRKDWKPSDEQMKALSWLVEYVAPSEEYIILIKKLYEQLKKL